MGRLASVCAVLAAIAGLAYAVSFVVLRDSLHAPLWLMLDGAFASVVLVAIHDRVREQNAAVAMWGLLMAVAGALGAMIHGCYDFAAAMRDAGQPGVSDAISAVDPRGLLTFGVAGVGLGVLVSLMPRAGFSRRLVALGYLSAGLSVVIFLARLIVVDPTKPVVVGPVLLEGFVVHPLFYLWLALALRRADQAPSP